MSVQIIMDRDVYLDSPVTPVTLTNAIYAGDSDAQRIRFRCFQKHGQIAPMDLSEITITAHFIRPDGGDVVITGVGGTTYSYVDLPEACYVYPGIFKLLVRASTTDPDVVTSVLYVTGRIDKPTTDVIIDPGTTIPSLEDLLAQIDTCEDATAAANTAAANANAAALAGVRTDTDAQGLSDTQKSNARTNIDAASTADISQLSEELTYLPLKYQYGLAVVDSYANGSWTHTNQPLVKLTNATNRIRPSAFIKVKAGDVVTINNGSSYKHGRGTWKDDNGRATNVEDLGWNTSNETFTITYDGFIIVAFGDKTNTNTDIDPSAFDGSIIIQRAGNALQYVGGLSNGDDLNSIRTNGWYSCTFAHTYTNAPNADTGRRLVMVVQASGAKTVWCMLYINYTTNKYYLRMYYDSAWDAWKQINDTSFLVYTMKRISDIPNGTDLNSLYENGWYTTSLAHNYPNNPEGSNATGRRMIFIVAGANPTAVSGRYMYYQNYSTNFTAWRMYHDGAWDKWKTTSQTPHDFGEFVKSGRIICHRGAPYPENTMVGIKNNYNRGTRIFEMDIAFTSDNVPVLLHDTTINRTARNADGTTLSATINIADITYSQALTYDFGIYKGSQYAGTKIASLQEALTFIRQTNGCAILDILGHTYTTAQYTILHNMLVYTRMLDRAALNARTEQYDAYSALFIDTIFNPSNSATSIENVAAIMRKYRGLTPMIIVGAKDDTTGIGFDYIGQIHEMGAIMISQTTSDTLASIKNVMDMGADLVYSDQVSQNEINEYIVT